ncbi:thiamine pyrophosphate-dependent dehydrogenase E1 component subunit alpha [Phytohabitans kaempferiae]|uniref:Thiamine pyrophosphate-dependent dehydrogenase E1 component subunit alpha n=1 Tax=Phytohabitans kaempferiae TaxID=1620943 RepID=A0ABV6M3R1_9ACTN
MTLVRSQDSARRREALTEPVARYERMYEIRTFEDRINELFARGLIHGTTHLCAGQEALDVSLALELRATDIVSATYRGHGIALALGMSPTDVLAEIMGKADGCAGGVGGSMHLAEPDVGLLPTFAIVGAGLPVAAGAALAFQTRREDRVAVSVFGDGAANIGAFHEALNLAAVWKLPVVFVCDNNVYAEYSRIDITTPLTDLHRRAGSYDIPGVPVDGMDVGATRAVLREAVARARAGEGPTLVEAKTYRFAGHSRADQATYRPAGELDMWRERDPVTLARDALVAAGTATEDDLATLEKAVREELDAVVEAVTALPEPEPAAMFRNIWAPAVPA